MKIRARDLKPDMMIPGVDGYVSEVEMNNGYLSYPGEMGAMPEDTVIVTVLDSEGEENYLLLNTETRVEVAE